MCCNTKTQTFSPTKHTLKRVPLLTDERVPVLTDADGHDQNGARRSSSSVCRGSCRSIPHGSILVAHSFEFTIKKLAVMTGCV